MSQSQRAMPDRVLRGFRALGSDIGIARRRHRNTVADMAMRANISIKTYRQIERGSPSVSIGAYAMVLYALGLDQAMFQLASPERDTGGLAVNLEALPERVVNRRRRRVDAGVDYGMKRDMDDDGVF